MSHRSPRADVEEVPLRHRAIEALPTGVTAFVGSTRRGPTDRTGRVSSFAEFERQYGRLDPRHPLGHAVWGYFASGGRAAVIGRVRRLDNGILEDDDLSAPGLEAARRGLWLLERGEPFDLLCVPPLGPGRDVGRATWDAALALAVRRRAVLLIDPPATWTRAAAITPAAVDAVVSPGSARANAAVYVPRLRIAAPALGGAPTVVPPGGAVAGVIARTDERRGVWKAPAGVEALLPGILGLELALTDADQAALNPRGINVIRTFPGTGPLVWGSRTLRGTDGEDAEWKYLPVRRFLLFLERSIDAGTQWAVFEPNDEPLWLALRAAVETFLDTLFRRGAMAGQTAREAYLVRCGLGSTMTQADLDAGVVVLEVGVAPLRPAEFVILRFRIRTAGS